MASNYIHENPWLLARSRYMEDLDEEEKKIFATASLENIFYSASAAQKDYEEMSRCRAISRKLEPLVGAIDQYGKALDVYSNTYSLAMAPLWGSIRVLLHVESSPNQFSILVNILFQQVNADIYRDQIAKSFEKYFKKLIDMFERIGDILPTCEVYQSLFPSHGRLLQAISVVYVDIIHFCMDAKTTFRKLKKSTTVPFILKSLWKDFGAEFEEVLTRFRNHVKNVREEAMVSNMIEGANERALGRADREGKERQRKMEKRNFLLSQLSSLSYADKHIKERQRRHPGTGVWLTKTDEFKEWMTGDCSTCLWCYGIPGSGKTILTSCLIDMLSMDIGRNDITIQHFTSQDIIDKDITSQDAGIAYYYCDFSDPKSLETRIILGTIIRQLLDRINISSDLEQQMDQLYRSDARTVADDELVALLFAVVKHFSKIYVFIDGLDECRKEEQITILSIVNQLAQSTLPAVKTLITSREEAIISTSLSGIPRLRVSADKNSADIAFFVEETVKSNIKSGALTIQDPSLESDIISALRNGAKGMFLWVYFQLADLCDAASDFAIRETLRNLPEGMAATYARALKKIGRSRMNTTLAQRIFKWIVCAKRPLLITELAEAIAFGPLDRSWDSTKVPDHSRLIQACGNLVVVDDDRTVRLAHHTVQQFLLEPPTKDSIPEFHFQRPKANVEAGEICVTYLSFSDFETQITISRPNNLLQASKVPGPATILDSVASPLGIRYVTSGIFKLWQYMRTGRAEQQPLTFDLAKFAKLKKPPSPSLGEKYRFLNYAIENWLSHTSDFSEDNTMWRSFRYLAMDKPTAFDIRVWGDSNMSNSLPYMGLFRWAIDAGHVPLLKLLLQLPRGSDLHAYCCQESDEDRSVVFNASHRGHANVIEFLVNQDCIDARDGRPLVKAAENGYDFAVRLLQEHGLCLEAKAEALQIAAASGHAAVMHVLLENEPPLDLRNGWGKFVLDEAAKRGSDGVLMVLLGKAASFEVAVIDLGKIWGGTALHEGAKRGFDGLVKLLLQEKGINPDSKDGIYGRTPLSWAADRGHEAVVRLLLLEKAVDPDSKDGRYGQTPLSLAAAKGHKAVVRLLLLEKAVDPDSKDGRYEQTPLSWAAANGHEAVVRLLLLEKAVDPDSKDEDGRTQTPKTCMVRHRCRGPRGTGTRWW